MEKNEIIKASVFRSHFEAALRIVDKDTQLEFLKAIISYQLYGEEPENLPEVADVLFCGILPTIDKELELKHGGRPQKEIPPENEIEAMRAELGSMSAVAENLGVHKATVYRHIKQEKEANTECRKTVACVANVAKTNIECRKKNEEIENVEKEKKENKNIYIKREQEKKEPVPCEAPSVEEVQAFCKENAYSIDIDKFFAYYQATKWHKNNGQPITDWRKAISNTWAINSITPSQHKARASPVSVQRENAGWHSVRTVF